MFQKLKDTLTSLNFQKLQRDAKIEFSRAQYRAAHLRRDLTSEFHKQLNNPRLRSIWQQAQSYRPTIDPRLYSRQQFAKKMNSMDSGWAAWRDQIVEWMDIAGRKVGRMVRKTAAKIDVPRALRSTAKMGKTLWWESKGLLEQNYRISRVHIKAYFRDNRQFFEYYRKKLLEFSPQAKRKILLFSAVGIFLYGIGSALPGAMLKYQLEQQRIKRENAILSPIATEETYANRTRGGEDYIPNFPPPTAEIGGGEGGGFEGKYK